MSIRCSMPSSEIIKVIQAWEDGQPVQYKRAWTSVGDPANRWTDYNVNDCPGDFVQYMWRVKPQARVIFVPVDSKNRPSSKLFPTEKSARSYGNDFVRDFKEVRKFREVLDEKE